MTVLVGVKCSDGIVIGSDSIATSSAGVVPVMQIESNAKIRVFNNSLIAAATGSVGVTQRLHGHIEAALKGSVFRNLAKTEAAGNISKRLIGDLQTTFHPIHPHHGIGFGALIAVEIKGEPCLVEYATNNFQPEFKEGKLFYVSMGSGQALADPFLAFVSKVLWKGVEPNVRLGKFGVYWTLLHTITLAPGTVGHPIKIATLENREGRWQASVAEDNGEAAQYISELESRIGDNLSQTIDSAVGIPLPRTPDPMGQSE